MSATTRSLSSPTATTAATSSPPTTSSHKRARITCPFYKLIPHTKLCVDAFNYGRIDDVSYYLLSHWHSDHYIGLTSSFNNGIIVCSAATARLVSLEQHVDPCYMLPLLLNARTRLSDGTAITLLEANHCPGAVLFLIEPSNGHLYLHTGDFRANDELLNDVQQVLNGRRLDVVWLDTTYMDSRYTFRSQSDVLNSVATLALTAKKEHHRILQYFSAPTPCQLTEKRLLFVTGAYSIGKDRVFITLAHLLDVHVYVSEHRYRTLTAVGDEAVTSILTRDQESTPLHVLPMSQLNIKSLELYLKKQSDRYDAICAFRPTGWTQIGPDKVKLKKKPITLHNVCYSEHSSYTELRNFCSTLRPLKVIPTVGNGDATKRNKMCDEITRWIS